MGLSLIAFTDGSGKNWESFQRTRNSVAYENMLVLLGEPAQPTYDIVATAIATTAAASHLLFINADGTLYTRIKRIKIAQVAAAGAATLAEIRVYRVSTAGTGGSAITARPRDAGDAAFGGSIQTLPTVKGTEGAQLLELDRLALSNTAPTTTNPNAVEWLARESEGQKALTIGPTSTDGIAIKIVAGVAGATVDITVTVTTDTAA